TLGRDLLAHDRLVVPEELVGAAVAEALVEGGESLDVAEQDGDRAVGRGVQMEVGTLGLHVRGDLVDRQQRAAPVEPPLDVPFDVPLDIPLELSSEVML